MKLHYHVGFSAVSPRPTQTTNPGKTLFYTLPWLVSVRVSSGTDHYLWLQKKIRFPQRWVCCVCVSRCADAVGSCEANGRKPQDIPAVMEVIPSSQGSPVIDPAALMLHLHRTDQPNGLSEPYDAFVSPTTTPASSMVTWASYWFFCFFFVCFLPGTLLCSCLFLEACRLDSVWRKMFYFDLYWKFAQTVIMHHHIWCDWRRQAWWYEMKRLLLFPKFHCNVLFSTLEQLFSVSETFL